MSDKKVCAVIVAAGSSRRFSGGDKLFFEIDGKSVLMRSIIAFENNSKVDAIAVVTREDLIEPIASIIEHEKICKCIAVVKGGLCREESVIEGLKIAEEYQIVLVHDAARPLVSNELITSVIDAAVEYGAAVPTVPVKDTIKTVSEDGFIAETPNRATLFAAQTPQGFLTSMYKKALSVFSDELDTVTDDSSVFENAGYRVKTVPGEQKNIKITTIGDIAIAEEYLKGDKAE